MVRIGKEIHFLRVASAKIKNVVVVPRIDPANTSNRKCCDRYILEYPTAIATKKNSIPNFRDGRHNATAKKNAKATVVCPEGKLSYNQFSTPGT